MFLILRTFLQKQSTCLGQWLFLQRSSVFNVCQICLRRFPPLGLHKGILNSSCLLILLIHTIHNTVRCNIGLTPRSCFLEGELIHWVGKAKNMPLIVGWLPIKAEWWDARLTPRDSSRSNIHNGWKGKTCVLFHTLNLLRL